MAQQTLTINNFTGGISNDLKVGIPNSFRFARNLNIFADANYLTPNPKTIKVSGSTVTNLPLWGIDGSPYDTNRYFYDLGGNIYRETSGGSWSNLRTVSGSQGQGLGLLDNYLYYAGATTLGRYGLLTGTPAFSDNFLADGVTNLDQSREDTAGNTYTPPTSITESATTRCDFVPTRDPVASIKILVVTKGSGNWTVTLHDANNNSLGAVTIANGSLANATLATFTLTTAARVTIGNEYHFHVTSSVADGTLDTDTSSDLNTATFYEYFGILISATYHPIATLLNGIVIGNVNYLAFWDGANYNPNQIQLEAGYQVRGLARENEFIIAYAWKGSSESNVEDARLYYWDGIQPTFNYSIPVSVGLPNAIISTDNKVLGVYGETGQLFVNTAPFELKQNVPLLTSTATIEVAPGAIGTYQSQIAIGYAFNTTDTTGLQQGVYLYGNKSDQFPEVMNMSFTISTGNVQASNLKIGMVLGLGDDLYIGWREGSTYGIDKVSKGNDPFTSGNFDTLIFDNSAAQKPKYANILVVEFEPLVSGESVTPKYAVDSNALSRTFTTGTTVSTVGATQAIIPITQRFNNISLGFNWTTTNTYLKITSVYFLFDDLAEERGW